LKEVLFLGRGERYGSEEGCGMVVRILEEGGKLVDVGGGSALSSARGFCPGRVYR